MYKLIVSNKLCLCVVSETIERHERVMKVSNEKSCLKQKRRKTNQLSTLRWRAESGNRARA